MIRVQTEDFDVAQEMERLTCDNRLVGGVCVFVGLVRDFGGEESLSRMTLEHYPGMTEAMLSDIVARANACWPLEMLTVIHRYGALETGDRIVFVGVAARHRDAAFEACRFIIDYLKTSAPFWKCEEKANGERHWVKVAAADARAVETWQDVRGERDADAHNGSDRSRSDLTMADD